MSTSNVGNSQVYEAGDQRNPPDSEKPENNVTRNEEGKQGSHKANDPKDERSIGNRLNAAEPQNDESSVSASSGKHLSKEDKLAQDDPTAPARMHGNEPSKGAKIDKSIEDEEAEIIRKMDAKKGK